MVKEPTQTQEPLAQPQAGSYRFTVEHYHKMGEAGILPPDVRTELVNSQIVLLMPIGKDPASAVTNLMLKIVRGLPEEAATITIQNFLNMGNDSELLPDVLILKYSSSNYHDHIPNPRDALLVIEVSDTTLKYDREVKLPKYAPHNIPKSRMVDLNGQKAWVYCQPSTDGYLHVQAHERGSTVKTLNLGLTVDEILGETPLPPEPPQAV